MPATGPPMRAPTNESGLCMAWPTHWDFGAANWHPGQYGRSGNRSAARPLGGMHPRLKIGGVGDARRRRLVAGAPRPLRQRPSLDGPRTTGVGSRFEVSQPDHAAAVYEVTDWRPGESFTWAGTWHGPHHPCRPRTHPGFVRNWRAPYSAAEAAALIGCTDPTAAPGRGSV